MPRSLPLICLFSVARCADLFEWFRSRGGYIHPALEMSTGPDPSWTVRGIFATEPIEADKTLIEAPRELQICGTHCSVTRRLHEEYALGEESAWWPYIEVLKQHDVNAIPLFWKENEQAWLNGAGSRQEWALDHTSTFCGFEFNEHSTWIVGVVSARSANVNDEICLVPVYDMFNHRNGQTWNSAPVVTPEQGVQLVSFGSIEEGDQVFNSFGSSTSNLYWQYGFVEQLAQSWDFSVDGKEFKFALEGNQVWWGQSINRAWREGQEISPEDLPAFKHQLRLYLQRLVATTPDPLERPESGLAQQRFDSAMAYRKAWADALELAIAQPTHEDL